MAIPGALGRGAGAGAVQAGAAARARHERVRLHGGVRRRGLRRLARPAPRRARRLVP